jgi:hypothetical protein
VNSHGGPLQQLLDDEQAWSLLPAPSQYQLPYSKVTFQVSLQHGSIGIGILPQ